MDLKEAVQLTKKKYEWLRENAVIGQGLSVNKRKAILAMGFAPIDYANTCFMCQALIAEVTNEIADANYPSKCLDWEDDEGCCGVSSHYHQLAMALQHGDKSGIYEYCDKIIAACDKKLAEL